MSLGLRVAVTGAAGSVGATLVERLAGSDEVDGIVAFDVLPVSASHPKVTAFRRDIREPIADILREHRVDAVVHLAFLLRPGHDREAARRVNVGGAARVVHDCRAADVRRLVYLSSTTVYGARPGAELPYTEDSPVRPIRGFQYAEDKAATERLLEAFAADNPGACVTVLRGCPVMAPGPGDTVTRVYWRLAGVRIAGADPQMQFIHMDDVVEALELCLLEPVPGVFNVAGRGAVAYSEIAPRRSPAPGAPAGAASRIHHSGGLVAAAAERLSRLRPCDGAMAVGGQQREAGARNRVPSALYLAGGAHELGTGGQWRGTARVTPGAFMAAAPSTSIQWQRGRFDDSSSAPCTGGPYVRCGPGASGLARLLGLAPGGRGTQPSPGLGTW